MSVMSMRMLLIEVLSFTQMANMTWLSQNLPKPLRLVLNYLLLTWSEGTPI